MSSVRLVDLNKRFGDQQIVRQVNLDVAAEEFCVFVGPSGCGKSTLLRMVAGLETPTSGEIFLDGERVTALSPGERDVSMVFQNYALFSHLSVGENLSFGLKLRRVRKPEIAQRVRQVAEALGLGSLLDRYPRQLSGGQRQRVALGRAIIRQPRLFLMDEPLSNLDALLRVQTRSEIVRLTRGLKATVIYVTHDQAEALSMGDKLVVLKDGTVQQVGTPREVYERPVNRFVATFFGTPSMNMVEEVTAEPVADGVRLTGTGLTMTIPDPGTVVPDRVTIGLRPEDVALVKQGSGWAPVDARVDLVEHMGSEQLVYLRLAGGASLVGRAAPDLPVHPGESVTAWLNERRIHLFDPATGQRL